MVGIVPGVTPDRWLRTWRERMPEVPLRITPISDAHAGPALRGGVDLVFARLPVPGVEPDEVHVIPLWEETPVVVGARGHPIKAFESVTLADLAGEQLHPGWDEATLDIVAAGHGIVQMPHAVLRATGRRDVVGRPITDATATRVGLAWLRTTGGPLLDEFVGIVRGRTANSSRGTQASSSVEPPAAKAPRAPTKRTSRHVTHGARRSGGRSTHRGR